MWENNNNSHNNTTAVVDLPWDRMAGYGLRPNGWIRFLSGSLIVIIGVLVSSWDLEMRTGRSMVDGMALTRVVTNELLHCGRTHSEPTKGNHRSWYHRARGRASWCSTDIIQNSPGGTIPFALKWGFPRLASSTWFKRTAERCPCPTWPMCSSLVGVLEAAVSLFVPGLGQNTHPHLRSQPLFSLATVAAPLVSIAKCSEALDCHPQQQTRAPRQVDLARLWHVSSLSQKLYGRQCMMFPTHSVRRFC